MSSLRAFIAIEIPAEIKKRIAVQTASLHTYAVHNNAVHKDAVHNNAVHKDAGRAVRWVTPDNFHLTLKFLGELSPANLDLLSQALQVECSQHAPFEIVVSGLGCFPNLRRPRVIWVGLNAPPELERLQRKVETAAAFLGYSEEDKAYSAHLTIGRIREQVSPDEIKMLQAAIADAQIGELGVFTVRGVTLFKSELLPEGPIYTPLFHARMGINPPG